MSHAGKPLTAATMPAGAITRPAGTHAARKPVLRRLLASRGAPALALFLLGPALYHRTLTPGWVIADWDLLFYFLPYRAYLARAWAQGRWLPTWNPHEYLGAPFLANIQAAALYPPNLLFALLPPTLAIGWTVALHAGLAGSGMYLYALQALRLRRAGGLVTGLVYMLGSLMVSQVGHLNQSNTLAWTPWLMLATDRAAAAPRPARLAGVAVLVGLVVAAGHTQQAYYTFLLAFIAGVARLWMSAGRRRLWARVTRSVLLLGAAVALGGALVALQLAATLELLARSSRSGGLSLAVAGSFALPPAGFLGDLLPDYTADHPAEYAASVGAAVLPLVALALATRWRRPAIWLWALLGAVALAVAFGPRAGVYDVAFHLLPGFDLFRAPARVLVFTTVAAAVLAGHGVRTAQQLALAWRRGHRRQDIARALGTSALLALVPVLAPLAVLLAGQHPNPRGLLRLFPTVQAENVLLTAGFEAAAAAVVVVAILAMRRRALGLLPLLVLADLGLLAVPTYAMNPIPDRVLLDPPPTAVLVPHSLDERYLVLVPFPASGEPLSPAPAGLSAADVDRYRFIALQVESYAPDSAMVQGALDADGYDGGILPLRSYVDFRTALVSPGAGNPPDFMDRLLGQHVWDERWLARAAISAVVTQRGTDPNPPGASGLVAAGGDGWLVAWRPALTVPPRAHLEDGTPARVVSDTGEQVTVRLPAGAAGRLVLADTYYPGWTATVDGRPVPVEPYDGYVRSVELPAGAHEVVFEYRPAWLAPGAAVSLAALALTATLAAMPLLGALRRRAAGPR